MEYQEGTESVIKGISFEEVMGRIQVSKTTAPHERADLINQFLDGINRNVRPPHRVATFKQVNGQLRKYGLQDLYILLNQCKCARNFGAFFWWKVRNCG